MKIYKEITDLIGNTPILEIASPETDPSIYASILGKLEYFNPAGSAKDRVALSVMQKKKVFSNRKVLS